MKERYKLEQNAYSIDVVDTVEDAFLGVSGCKNRLNTLEAELQELRQENARLEKALRKYGQHADSCVRGELMKAIAGGCSCGLDATLAAETVHIP